MLAAEKVPVTLFELKFFTGTAASFAHGIFIGAGGTWGSASWSWRATAGRSEAEILSSPKLYF